MITAEEARKMADEFLENRIGESRRRVEKEISEAAARGEVVIHIGGPIPQELTGWKAQMMRTFCGR